MPSTCLEVDKTRGLEGGLREGNKHLAGVVVTNLWQVLKRYQCPLWHQCLVKWIFWKYHFHLMIELSCFSLCVELSASLPTQGLSTCSYCIWDTFAFTLYLIVVITLSAVGSGRADSWLQTLISALPNYNHVTNNNNNARCKRLLTVSVIMKNVSTAGATSIKLLSHKTLLGFYGTVFPSI